MSGGPDRDDGALRDDPAFRGEAVLPDEAALREAFAELRRAEEAAPPTFASLVLRPRRSGARAGRARGRAVWTRSGTPGLVPRFAAAAAVVVAAAVGVWLGRSPATQPAAVDGSGETSLATWQAPTDFLLDTPGIELLRTTPEIPGPLPATLAAADSNAATGETR